GVRPQQRRENADEGRFARSVGPQEAEHRALLDSQGHAPEGDSPPEALDHAFREDGWCVGRRSSHRGWTLKEHARSHDPGSQEWLGPALASRTLGSSETTAKAKGDKHRGRRSGGRVGARRGGFALTPTRLETTSK